VALQLEGVEQRISFNTDDFERGIARAQALLRQFQAELARGTTGPAKLQQSLATVGRMPSLPASERSLRQLQSTLGGAERASSQLKTAQDRLNQAFSGGAVSIDRYRQLQANISRTFTESNIRAKDLRGNMVSLNAGVLALVASFSRLGAIRLPAVLSSGAAGGGLGSLGAGAAGGLAARALPLAGAAAVPIAGLGGAVAGAVTAAMAGERIQLQRALVEALGAPGAREQLLELGLQVGDVEAVIATFQRLIIARDELGVSTERVIDFEHRLLEVLRLQGGLTDSARAGIFQLSQALASGRLQGDELRSVLENLPIVAKAIGDGLVDMGIAATGSTAEIRRLASEGRLSAREIFDAFIRGSEEAVAAAQAMPEPIARSMGRATAAIAEGLGIIGEWSGATELAQSSAES
jgi:tape measure domain-containing protein